MRTHYHADPIRRKIGITQYSLYPDVNQDKDDNDVQKKTIV
jgi:hypothetical protein